MIFSKGRALGAAAFSAACSAACFAPPASPSRYADSPPPASPSRYTDTPPPALPSRWSSLLPVRRWALAQPRSEGFDLDCDVLIVGAGVVGLAVARELAVLGNSVVVLEKDASVCAGASSETTFARAHASC